MNKLFFLLGLWSMVGIACNSNEHVQEATLPRAAKAPASDLQFEQLIYENNYNGVPLDDDPAYYVNNILDSALIGMAYKLTNSRAFAPGVFAEITPSKEKRWYKVSVRALKRSSDLIEPLSARGQMVFSWERAGQTIHYQAYPIKDLLAEQNKQIIDKWETVEVWQEVPDSLQQGDVFKTYVWNAAGGDLYIDDFTVTAWKQQRPLVNAKTAKLRTLMDQGYEHENPSNDFTTKYAHRGVYSNAVARLPNYNEYGKTYSLTAQEQQLQGGTILRISFAALMHDKILKSDEVALMVCAVERDGQSIYWDALGINSRLWKDGKQLMQEWKELEWWQVLPEELRPTDVIKVYAWNTLGTIIYIDDLKVEAVEQ